MNDPQKLTTLLVANGLRPTIARILTCYVRADVLTQRDIELMARLRQPEVSLATMHMVDRGWLQYTISRDGSQGAPRKHYSLTAPLADIVQEIVTARMTEIERAQMTANQLLQAVA